MLLVFLMHCFLKEYDTYLHIYMQLTHICVINNKLLFYYYRVPTI